MSFKKFDGVVISIIKNIYFYLRLIYMTIFQPRRAFGILKRNKKILVGVYFFSNVSFVIFFNILNISKKKDSLEVDIPFFKAISIESVMGFFSYFLGIVIFAYLLRYILKKYNKINYSYWGIVRILILSSGVFIPIIFMREILAFLLKFYMYDFSGTNQEIGYILGIIILRCLVILAYELWWLNTVFIGIKILKIKGKIVVAGFLICVNLFNFIIGILPGIPPVVSLYKLNTKIEYYNDLKSNIVSDSLLLMQKKLSPNDTSKMIDNVNSAQLISMDLALNPNTPRSIRYRYAISSLSYYVFLNEIGDIKTTEILYSVLINDYDTAEKNLENYLSKREKSGTLENSLLENLLETVRKSKVYKSEKANEEETLLDDIIKSMIINRNKNVGIWSNLISITP